MLRNRQGYSNLFFIFGQKLTHMSLTPLLYLNKLKSIFEKQGDPITAEGQMKYMRNQFEFYGLKAPRWQAVAKEMFKSEGIFDGDDLKEFVRLSYEDEYREVHYVATEMVQRRVKKEASDFVVFLEELVLSKSWWDTVDWISKLIGIHFKKYPEQRRLYCEKWIESDNIWLQRTAIICHRFDKIELDFELMEEMILRRADSKEFFIQKGAGWALRDYSKVNPDRVVAFIKKNPQLANLTKREGLKWLKSRGVLSHG